MWYKQDVKTRMELMKTYRNGGFSYRDMVDDYNSSYKKYADGGEVPKLDPYITYDPSDPRIQAAADTAMMYDTGVKNKIAASAYLAKGEKIQDISNVKRWDNSTALQNAKKSNEYPVYYKKKDRAVYLKNTTNIKPEKVLSSTTDVMWNQYPSLKQEVILREKPQIPQVPYQPKEEYKPTSGYGVNELGQHYYDNASGDRKYLIKSDWDKQILGKDSVKKYNHGGVHEDPPSMQLPNQYYNPSENVNQQPVIDPYLRAQQINKSNYIPALTIEQQKERDKQEYINQYVKEGVKKVSDFAPFKAAAYLTPAGMAVGAIEGAANIGPDLYNKEYGSAALDAVSMLPFASNYKEAYKYNPWRFKADPEAYYHRSPDINQVLVDNKLVGYGLTSEGKKITEDAIKKYGKDIVNLKKAANDEPYFSKGTPLDWGRYNPVKSNWAGRTGEIAQGYKGPYLAEAKNVDFVAKADNRLQKVWSKDGTAWERGIAPNEIGAYATPVQGYVPKENLNFYKEHWWKGYKKINK